MAILSLPEIRSFARLKALDVDPLQPAMTDAQWDELINEAQQDYFAEFPTAINSTGGTLSVTAGEYSATVTGTRVLRRATELLHSNGKPLEWYEVAEIRYLIAIEAGTGVVNSLYWSALRDPSDHLKWTVYVYPAQSSGAQTLALWGEVEPVLLSGTAKPPTGEHGCRHIGLLAAARGAGLIGRPQSHIESLAAALPPKLAAKAFLNRRYRDPADKAGI